MTKKMIIDATHKEETRVAITDGNKLVEYDYESQSRKPLKGSIFLAKVTRVEPSLQAAFVNFGGNRHGFLPFSEIHPDYFKIPVADREALMAEQEALIQEHDEEEALEDEESDEDSLSEEDEELGEPEEVGGDLEGVSEDEALEEDNEAKKKTKTTTKKLDKESQDSKAPDESENVVPKDVSAVESDEEGDASEDQKADESASENVESEDRENGDSDNEDNKKGVRRRNYRGRGRGRGNKRASYRNRSVEVVGGDEIEGEKRFRFNLRRKYKIQEVIKRGQIMLVQANKEERGNKGAAVGSYLSLPGRYCVLMPNSPRAGGVSRKIANHKDRARMRDIVKSLEVPKGMSVIVRTAGVTRTKAEIKRDLDYLMRLWDNIRELTLQSSAPALVYEEADLIKRAVRDLYTRDVEEILVAGEKGYETAKNFMKMMIPSHVKKVKQYESGQLPLFNRYQIESQINEIGQPEVRLKSGGYLVINPTEALVSIDVNSGKSTKGRHIEETALKTNLEAADEVARQLKLRDLGGLVVIDFIDMEERRNNSKVERRMKEALSNDRARVQVGRISSFGLMELSRQRLSPSLMEAQFKQCNNCNGLGLVRTDDAMSILVLRAIEDEGIRGRAAQIIVQVTGSVALYILNYKRKKLAQIEERYGFEVLLRIDDTIAASEYLVEVSKPAVDADKSDDVAAASSEDGEEKSSDSNRPRRRGRRGGRGRKNVSGSDEAENTEKVVESSADQDKGEISDKPSDDSEEKPKRRRGRRKPQEAKSSDKDTSSDEKKGKSRGRKPDDKSSGPAPVTDETKSAANDDSDREEKPKKKPVRRKATAKKAEGGSVVKDELSTDSTEKVVDKKDSVSKTKESSTPKDVQPTLASKHETVNKAPKQKKKGWWNRL